MTKGEKNAKLVLAVIVTLLTIMGTRWALAIGHPFWGAIFAIVGVFSLAEMILPKQPRWIDFIAIAIVLVYGIMGLHWTLLPHSLLG